MRKKKAQGHVEIIISFVLFVGVLIFVFLFLNPFTKTQAEIPIRENVQKNIINNITSDLGKLTIFLNETGSGCYNFDETRYLNENYKEIPETESKYIIYFSDAFPKKDSRKDPSCLIENYKLSSYSVDKIISFEKIKILVQKYNTDYISLKTSLGISYEFSFNIKDLAGTQIAEASVSKEIPEGLEVGSREFPIRTINSDGLIKEYILNIRAWG